MLDQAQIFNNSDKARIGKRSSQRLPVWAQSGGGMNSDSFPLLYKTRFFESAWPGQGEVQARLSKFANPAKHPFGPMPAPPDKYALKALRITVLRLP